MRFVYCTMQTLSSLLAPEDPESLEVPSLSNLERVIVVMLHLLPGIKI